VVTSLPDSPRIPPPIGFARSPGHSPDKRHLLASATPRLAGGLVDPVSNTSTTPSIIFNDSHDSDDDHTAQPSHATAGYMTIVGGDSNPPSQSDMSVFASPTNPQREALLSPSGIADASRGVDREKLEACLSLTALQMEQLDLTALPVERREALLEVSLVLYNTCGCAHSSCRADSQALPSAGAVANARGDSRSAHPQEHG